MMEKIGFILSIIGISLIIFMFLYFAYLIHWTVSVILAGLILCALGDELMDD